MTIKKGQNKTKVMTYRLPRNIYDQFEISCLEKKIPMSLITIHSVYNFLNNFDMQPNDKIKPINTGGV